MERKYSCSQSTIDGATMIYDKNNNDIREYCHLLYGCFREEYSDFLRCDVRRDICTYTGRRYAFSILGGSCTRSLALEPIFNIVLYIPNNILKACMKREPKFMGDPKFAKQLRDEFRSVDFTATTMLMHASQCWI